MQASFLPYKDTSLYYQYGGVGKRLLFCFHGFGESAQHFSFLENHLSEHFTIVAIDLPYHGNSRWKQNIEIDPHSFLDTLEGIKLKHGFTQQSYELLGYSMGGRIALSLLQVGGLSINKVFLLAPDGFKMNFWYWLATQTNPGNRMFSATVNQPKPFLWVVKQLHRIGFLNQSIYKYVQVHLHDREIRKQLYLRWTCMRKFKPDLEKIKKVVRQQNVLLVQLYGKHDRIILPNRGQQFSNSIHPLGKLEVINCGHKLLDEKNINIIVAHLLQ